MYMASWNGIEQVVVAGFAAGERSDLFAKFAAELADLAEAGLVADDDPSDEEGREYDDGGLQGQIQH
ncbi:MAG: hypothetical protein M5R42_11290 [Rhodocyclaceae bacterium]|nr:hypothetical protein [Rhodocyclaceae bacterium]